MDPEGPALFQTLEDVIDAVRLGLEPAVLPGPNQFLFARTTGGPFQGQAVIESEVLNPLLIVAGARAQKILGEFGMAADLLEKVHPLVFPQQVQQVARDDDPVKTVINPLQIGPKELKKELHRGSPSVRLWLMISST
jgi:hypothetical protein